MEYIYINIEIILCQDFEIILFYPYLYFLTL
jgi:hypothetical protein